MKDKEINQLHNLIIDTILNSELNIDSIPDDLEKELYGVLLKVLQEKILLNPKCCFSFLKKKK